MQLSDNALKKLIKGTFLATLLLRPRKGVGRSTKRHGSFWVRR
jgi:hypothetical protein